MRTVFQRAHRDGKTTATKADKHHAELRSEQATSRWRTALRDHKIIQNDDSSWSVVHWSGRVLGKFDDAVAASAALAS